MSTPPSHRALVSALRRTPPAHRQPGHDALSTEIISSLYYTAALIPRPKRWQSTIVPKAGPPRPSASAPTSTSLITPKDRNLQPYVPRRNFQNYFVTHLPSSSQHPDSAGSTPPGPHHKLPRSAARPHEQSPGSSPAVVPPNIPNRNLTVVRIPLRSAKHHFGVAVSRGSRPYNEDTNQAGTINMPAFAKRAPISLVHSNKSAIEQGEGMTADSAFGDPQIFYFAVFDGHGGVECSEFLKNELHGYIEEAAAEFSLGSSLRSHERTIQLMKEQAGRQAERQRRKEEKEAARRKKETGETGPKIVEEPEQRRPAPTPLLADEEASGTESLDKVQMKAPEEVQSKLQVPESDEHGAIKEAPHAPAILGSEPQAARVHELPKAILLERELLAEYKRTIGGYFRRFKPSYFDLASSPDNPETLCVPVTIESVLTYAFLRTDLDFVSAQARKPDPNDPYVGDIPLNHDEVLGQPNHLPPGGSDIMGLGGKTRFKGGSTASIALISTPTPAPFWHPAAHASIMVAHVGDTRVVLCETATGLPKPLTSDHHPSSPAESRRLTRYAESLITDSFGDQRVGGQLANSRAFGDMSHKRIGVSAEPEITRIDMGPAQYSFLVLCSDGVSGTLSDQEIVDIIKEARTPEEGARQVVEYATEVSRDGDNATCLVVRLGGWERRSEGGLGSLGTKEIRDMRREEALDPRRRRS